MAGTDTGGGASTIWRPASQHNSSDVVAKTSNSCHLVTSSDSPTAFEQQYTTAADDDSPTRRRNKRKMTEPRRRATDFSIRSICSTSHSDDDGDDDDDDDCRNRLSSECAAKVRKLYDVDRDCTITTPPTANSFSYYPLNIPLLHAYQRAAAAAAAATLPVPGVNPAFLVATGSDGKSPLRVRPQSVGSSLGSSGDQERSAVGDDTSSSVGAGLCPPNSDARTPSADNCPAPGDSRSSNCSPVMATAVNGADLGGPRASSPRKNYKNMTKQRRIEANARERTRVHTISAAFESLRRAVPSYSYNQRLSKLAILRIACSYIMALARLADVDYSSASTSPSTSEKSLSFAECVDLCTQTIQAEGRAKRRH